MTKFLDGYKSYIIGVIMILTGGAELVGIDVIPGVEQTSAFAYIMAGFAMFAVKSAITKSGPTE